MNANSNNVFAVANLVQAALFQEELKGQFSDGMWENSRPLDHWKSWCNAKVVINPVNVGRNFWVDKDNYNLHSLIDPVGDRMLVIARATVNFPALVVDLIENECGIPNSSFDYEYYVSLTYWKQAGQDVPDYAQKVADIFAKHNISVADYDNAVNGGTPASSKYTMRELRKDLTAIKQAMKIFSR